MNDSACSLIMLGNNSGAHIAWCPDCGNFHLSLGFVHLKLTTAQYKHLLDLMNTAMNKVNDGRPTSESRDADRSRTKRELH